jgi:hypothetical protein
MFFDPISYWEWLCGVLSLPFVGPPLVPPGGG